MASRCSSTAIAKTTPFVYDTLVGFQHSIEARPQTVPTGNATFASWSDGGAAAHTLTVPAADQGYTATYTVTPVSAPIAFVQVAAATPQTNQTAVPVALPTAQVAGNLNAVVVGWNDVAANVASVTDTAGNTYLPAAPVTRGAGISQGVYYAANIAGGANTVTVTFDRPAAYVDVRVAEYSGLDRASPRRHHRVGGRHGSDGQQRERDDDRGTYVAARRRDDHRRLRGGRQRLHDAHHHPARPRHPRRQSRDGGRRVQRHGRRRRGMGDAARRLPRRRVAPDDG